MVRCETRQVASRGIVACVLLAAVLAVAWAPVAPERVRAADLTAEQILDKLEGTTMLTGSGSATIELVTENKRGQQRSNKLRVFRSKAADGTEKQLLEYLSPADVAGTKLLSITGGQETQIWLFMPALGRERRIAGAETRTKFMGTDFTYEEISGGSAYKDDYKAERLKDEDLDGRNCYVLRLTPTGESDYGFVKMWVWRDEFIPLKIEFYNRDGKVRKVLSNLDLKKSSKGKWEPSTIVMSDVVAGTKTIIKILEMSGEPVPDEYFTVRYLRRR
ncbi:MAG: outer membrane lipoprotein-sorting protein [Firmicutes bacterium]|nr:outer membrane lipoprotein-sorting protein [Bacillota bacterium]